MAHRGPDERRYALVFGQGEPLGERHLDLRFRLDARVDAPAGRRVVDEHGSFAEQVAVRHVVVLQLAGGDLVVDPADVLERTGYVGHFVVVISESEEQFGEFAEPFSGIVRPGGLQGVADLLAGRAHALDAVGAEHLGPDEIVEIGVFHLPRQRVPQASDHGVLLSYGVE